LEKELSIINVNENTFLEKNVILGLLLRPVFQCLCCVCITGCMIIMLYGIKTHSYKQEIFMSSPKENHCNSIRLCYFSTFMFIYL